MIPTDKESTLLGIFDSGIGGFSVLDEVKKYTKSDIVYFGDCARSPYGNKPEEEIVGFIKEILLSLSDKGVTHFVSACNSMSVLTTGALLKECGINNGRYVDMMRAFRKHSDIPPLSCVIIAATRATIKSGEYQSFLKSKGLQVHTYVFPDLAGKIEEGKKEVHFFDEIKESFVLAKFVGATHYVYGCTHYPLIRHVFEKCAEEIGWSGTFIDPAEYVTSEVKEWGLNGNGKISFITSKETEMFKKYARASIEI